MRYQPILVNYCNYNKTIKKEDYILRGPLYFRCLKSAEWPGLLDQTKPLKLSKTLRFEEESSKRTPTPPLQLLPGKNT